MCKNVKIDQKTAERASIKARLILVILVILVLKRDFLINISSCQLPHAKAQRKRKTITVT